MQLLLVLPRLSFLLLCLQSLQCRALLRTISHCRRPGRHRLSRTSPSSDPPCLTNSRPAVLTILEQMLQPLAQLAKTSTTMAQTTMATMTISTTNEAPTLQNPRSATTRSSTAVDPCPHPPPPLRLPPLPPLHLPTKGKGTLLHHLPPVVDPKRNPLGLVRLLLQPVQKTKNCRPSSLTRSRSPPPKPPPLRQRGRIPSRDSYKQSSSSISSTCSNIISTSNISISRDEVCTRRWTPGGRLLLLRPILLDLGLLCERVTLV